MKNLITVILVAAITITACAKRPDHNKRFDEYLPLFHPGAEPSTDDLDQCRRLATNRYAAEITDRFFTHYDQPERALNGKRIVEQCMREKGYNVVSDGSGFDPWAQELESAGNWNVFVFFSFVMIGSLLLSAILISSGVYEPKPYTTTCTSIYC